MGCEGFKLIAGGNLFASHKTASRKANIGPFGPFHAPPDIKPLWCALDLEGDAISLSSLPRYSMRGHLTPPGCLFPVGQ